MRKQDERILTCDPSEAPTSEVLLKMKMNWHEDFCLIGQFPFNHYLTVKKYNLIVYVYVPAAADFPELISSKTADIPSLGRDDAVSELKSGVAGGGGGTGALAAGAFVIAEEDDDEETTATVPQAGPKG
ncbi:hypothetical protein GW17_00020948 [Ensete ventricosum]|nr:hypothetical protein GW17_00020948 [Ensete ventricosum]